MIKETKQSLVQKNTQNVTGLHPEIFGDFSNIKGDVSKIKGNVSIHKINYRLCVVR